MGSGLSMTSVNKIKELANSREYSLALEIVDSQDLSKSLNPQFLRLCGEIYTKNGRYKDARRVLVMAHRLAPEAKRIIYSFVDLYLRVGYKKLAKTYYELYLFDADENSEETKQIKYIYDKANGADLSVLEEHIAPHYSQFMDYDWSFETCLLYKLQGNDSAAASLAEEYSATFKNSDNCSAIKSVVSDNQKASQFFDVFAKDNIPDDDPEQAEVREEEKKLLEADDLRIHPKEAEITIIFDDNEEPDTGSKRKLRKFLKEQDKEASGALDSDATEPAENENRKPGLLQKVFARKKKQHSEEALSEAESVVTADVKEAVTDDTKPEIVTAADESVDAEAIPDTVVTDKSEEIAETEIVVTAEPEQEEVEAEENQHKTEPEIQPAVLENNSSSEQTVDENVAENTEDFDMQEIHSKQHKSKYSSIVSIEADDGFAAESETIEDLKDDYDYSNPFESISALKKEKEEYKFVPKRKTEILFEDAEIAPEESEDEFEVDDFSSAEEDEFGEMQGAYIVEEAEELEEDSETAEAEKYEAEDAETLEAEETETFETETENFEVEEVEVFEAETKDFEAEEAEVFEAEPEVFEEEEAETFEAESEVFEAEESEADAYEIGAEEPAAQEIITSEVVSGPVAETNKKKMDFPIFRTSLFPEYNQKVHEVENNFDTIMTEAQGKIQENILKEEQMQREAEALLTSLGINLNDINVTATSYESIGDVLYDGPSRDELKASLKIDSVKKDILKRLKEYR